MKTISDDSVGLRSDVKSEESPFVYYEDGFQLRLDGSLNGRKVENLGEDTVVEQKQKRLSRFFEENMFHHVLVLSGAGTSIAAGGKTREGLWKACQQEIDGVNEAIEGRDLHCKSSEDIEEFLSHAERLYSVMENNEKLKSAIVALKKAIRDQCNIVCEAVDDHENLLRKLTARKPGLPRFECFTTNYDTLFEQAARKAGFVVIDGFSFSFPRTFSGRYFDLDIVNRERTRLKGEENFIPNVFHLLKLHGSIDWFSKNDGTIEQRECEENAEPLIIYPSSEKYAASYDQPYFEMMSRFQTALRRDNTLLIVLGFGFADKHLNNAIIEAVRQNPGFHLLVSDFGHPTNGIDLQKYQDLFGSIGGNISIVHASFRDFVNLLPMNRSYVMPRLELSSVAAGESRGFRTI